MQLTLKIPGGGTEGTLLLRQGQVARVGRTEWADYCVAHDDTLGEFHFAVECGNGSARVIDLQSGQPTWVNGEAVSEAELQHGDHIRAGETMFVVELSGVSLCGCQSECHSTVSLDDAPSNSPEETKPTEPAQPASLAQWCQVLEMGPQASALLTDDVEPWTFVERLSAKGFFPEALRLAGALLTPIKNVAWGSAMVRQSVGSSNDATCKVLDVADTWVADPSEQNRRQCEAIAQANNFDGPASWIALGAFWSDGSMGPADQPAVPPPIGLTAKAVTGALMMAATADPLQANSRYHEFLAAARTSRPNAV